jgi:Cellulase (glycosyl hydrolase family 5)
MASLLNDLGTGVPTLTMTLVDSGQKWNSYVLDYKHEGGVPGGVGDKAWSSWDIHDKQNNWYGTINLLSDGERIWPEKDAYTPPQRKEPHSRNLLTHFSVSELSPGKYKLTVEDVYPSFPLALKATPAVWTNPPIRPIVLRTDGPKIVNDRGDTVVLKGVTRPSLEWPLKGLPEWCHGQHLSPLDMDNMHNWGANVIRITLNQFFWLNSKPREVIGSYRQIVDAMIYNAILRKMAVILDLHQIAPNVPGLMANGQSIDFWTDVAKTYKDFGTVLFELFNEPHDLDADKQKAQGMWLNGDKQKQYAGYQQLYKAVRDAGANNLCIIGGLDWAYDLSFVKSDFGVKGTNIVYCSHPYYPKGVAGPSPLFKDNFAGVLGKFPVILTEFGGNLKEQYDQEGAKPFLLDYYNQVISLVNKYGFHYTGWGWWVESDKPEFPCLIGDWAGTPINGGKIIKDDLQKKPGKGVG